MTEITTRRRALIVEDEFLIANDFEAAMHALGFDDCDLAPNAGQARSLSPWPIGPTSSWLTCVSKEAAKGSR